MYNWMVGKLPLTGLLPLGLGIVRLVLLNLGSISFVYVFVDTLLILLVEILVPFQTHS